MILHSSLISIKAGVTFVEALSPSNSPLSFIIIGFPLRSNSLIWFSAIVTPALIEINDE